MNSSANPAKSPQQVLLDFLDERIQSCEKKRKQNQFFMNSLKFIRIVSGVFAVLFVALLAADGFENKTKFIFNIAAIISTSLTALGLEISNAFGFESRFQQNVKSSGKLRTMKSKLLLEISMSQSEDKIDYTQWHNSIVQILEGQSVKFDADFEKAHKKK